MHADGKCDVSLTGVAHADELHYVFGAPLSDDLRVRNFVTNWTDDDRRVSCDVITMWTNFAKYGYVSLACKCAHVNGRLEFQRLWI